MFHTRLRTVFWLMLWCLALPVHSVAAEATMSFPLGPFYRPGRYLPVHVVADASSGAQDVRIAAPVSGEQRRGAIETRISLGGGRIDAIVPWMVLNAGGDHPRLSVGEAVAVNAAFQLKRLGDSERLVGWTTPDESFARVLLHGAPKIIPVVLDPSQPIPGDPAAWELLDAVILDATSGARLEEEQLAGLLAAGVTVAVKGAMPPYPALPWKPMGGYMVLRYSPAGPITAGYHEGVYLPVADWQTGLPWRVRRQVILVGILCSLPLAGLALWRPRRTALWGLVIGGVISAGVGAWASTHRAIQQAAGEIVVLGDGVTQTDAWTYQSSATPRIASVKWDTMLRPMLSDDIEITLDCDGAGVPTGFTTRIPSGRKVAFLSRSVGVRVPKNTPTKPITSPLADVVDQLYLNDGGHVIGELRGATSTAGLVQWNAVVVDRRKPGSH